jgi:hypothetical protein
MHIPFSDRKLLPLIGEIILFRLIMSYGKTVFAQIMDIIPDYEFEKCIDKYKGGQGNKEIFL